MILISSARRVSVLLLCSALLLLRVGGTHWHLCFDGREPPVSIHVTDSSIDHAAAGVDNQHEDQNVDVDLASLIKNGAGDCNLPFIAFTLLLLCASFARPRLARPRKSDAPHFDVLSVFLPPLRGPPSIAIS